MVDEASGGDPDAVVRRLAAIDGIPLLEATEGTDELMESLIRALALPQKAAADAAHIALTVVNGIEFLLTWNCTHIANAALRPSIEATCRAHGYEMPVICTPEELLED